MSLPLQPLSPFILTTNASTQTHPSVSWLLRPFWWGSQQLSFLRDKMTWVKASSMELSTRGALGKCPPLSRWLAAQPCALSHPDPHHYFWYALGARSWVPAGLRIDECSEASPPWRMELHDRKEQWTSHLPYSTASTASQRFLLFKALRYGGTAWMPPLEAQKTRFLVIHS